MMSVAKLKLNLKLVRCNKYYVNFNESLSTTILLDKSQPTSIKNLYSLFASSWESSTDTLLIIKLARNAVPFLV